MKDLIVRDNFGDIDLEKSLEKFKENLISLKSSEIPSDKISEEIDSVFSSYDGQLSMNFILTQVCTKLEYKSQDHNKIVDKIKAVIKNKVKEGALKLKVGKGGGFSK